MISNVDSGTCFDFPEASLDEAHRVVRDLARRFATDRLSPIAEKMDREEYFPRDLFLEAGKLGLIGIALPLEYEGGGMDLLAAGIVREELARVSPAFAASIAISAMYAGFSILKFGTEAQKEKYVPRLASGEAIGSWALTEPDAGSDAQSIQTTSSHEGTSVTIRGQKTFITNAPVADVVVVLTRASDADGASRFRMLLVETNSAGLTVGPKMEKVGFRGSPTGELFFDDVVLDESAILGPNTMTFTQCAESLQLERVLIVFSGLGIATSCLREALDYSKVRNQFGRPVGDFQLVQQKLANIAMSVALLRSYAQTLVIAYSNGEELRMMAAIGKYATGQMVLSAATDAMQVFGGAGYMKQSPIERHWRDARLLSIGGGTSEIQQLVIARELLK